MDFTAPLGRVSRPRASTCYARSDPRAANAALGVGKIYGPSLGGGIMYHFHVSELYILAPLNRTLKEEEDCRTCTYRAKLICRFVRILSLHF
jgi:hypothetical protein